MVRFIKQLFCKHRWYTPIFKNSMGHAVMAQGFLKRRYTCTKCGKVKYIR